MKKHLASDYVRTVPGGKPQPREEVMAEFRSHKFAPGGTMVPSELRVRIYGDTAILNGHLTTSDPSGAIRHSRFTKVFIQKSGDWCLVSLQGSLAAE